MVKLGIRSRMQENSSKMGHGGELRSNMTRFEQFARFAGIGALATVLHYAILIAFVQYGLVDPVTASTIGFALSALGNYALNRTFTFRSSRPHTEALPRFAAVTLLGLAINASLIWLFHILVGLHYLLAQVLATAGTLSWNFAVNRTWTFADSAMPHHGESR
jgi:putative flippase GtrA